jgi:diguanylate cyclase (GGDEF)-like protein
MDEDHGAGERRDPGSDRDRIADDRDQRAEDHDLASAARDHRADERDERAEARERTADVVDVEARVDRRGASRDRQGSSSDRTRSADDRRASSADRADSAQDRVVSSIDVLTGAHRRDAGIVEMGREVARAQRTKQPLTLAFVDVDHLKETNDCSGHIAGDRLLRATADAIRTNLRSYDLIIRYGGDEFVCALLDMTVAQAAGRFSLVNTDLAAQQASVTVGLAHLEADDALEDLIARADNALYKERQQRRSAGD